MPEKYLVVHPAGPEGRELKKPNWIYDTNLRRLWSPKLGVAEQMVDVVDSQTGQLDHEGKVFLERRTELSIPVDEAGCIGFVFIRREKVIPPSLSRPFFEKSPHAIPPLELIVGVEEYELPHGLSSRKAEEVEEEIGRKVVEIIDIGDVKDSPPHGGTAHILTVVRVGREPSGKHAEAGEQIRRVEFFRPEEVRGVIARTICGLTKAALWTFRSWGLDERPKGSFWHDVASRL